ncbi:cytochrome c3 family protein [Desulfofustis limnaeus]|uniref:Class III cytochrome C domain-containing protein n=1 Tax=Desulfofustis limnaeus TaxID=2740163 RepID=A0ABM7W6U5_9BACT|nr:cytochrome c3 family protein [Desulfofustis limnaeus]BDD86580.1 hypothetical protein DPPLL_09450 [Desulfofustis limnaeus]
MTPRTLTFLCTLTVAATGALQGPGTAAAGADDPPETVVIDVLSNRYATVTFDHRLHAAYAACSACHHHTTGDAATDPACSRCHSAGSQAGSVSCASCHPAQPFSEDRIARQAVDTSYHIDLPGLQGAYHLNCLACHEAIGGPTGCLDCHQRQP